MACLQARAQFIQGNGFKDEALSKMVVHRSGLKMDTVLSRLGFGVGYFEVICLHISFNGLGQISGFRPIPVEFIRVAEPDDMGYIYEAAICPFLDSTYNARKKNEFTKLPLFNPDPEVVLEQIEAAGGITKYQGQLLYEPFWMPGDSYYHDPSYLTAFQAIQNEGELDIYDWSTIQNGFNSAGMLVTKSRRPADAKNYDPMLDVNSIEYQLQNNMGAKNGGKLLVVNAETEEEMKLTNFVSLSDPKLADRYLSTSERAEQKITRAMRVPNEIVNIRKSGGIAPTGDEVIVASHLMYQMVNPFQRKISEVIEYIFKYWKDPISITDFSIQNLNYFPEGLPAKKATETAAQPIQQTEITDDNMAQPV
jgi:hypothetical protein